ncbi:helix-turn-helix domain-containing protein [Halomonas heilongjiangensis]|nr:AraC family transcriptional regulator [Halomonas heilongjiangensis]
MIVEEQSCRLGTDRPRGGLQAVARLPPRQPGVVVLDRQALDPDALGHLLGEFADAPIIVILGPGESFRRVQQALQTALFSSSGSANDASPAPDWTELAHHGGLADWQVRRLEAYIDAHLDETIHVRDLAAIARLSLGHFAHAFKQAFGEPPLAHVTHRRLELACARMLAGDEPLSRIAQECGFCDQSHFTRHFHRAMGMAPQRWRRLHAPGPG